jgi:regulatory protein
VRRSTTPAVDDPEDAAAAESAALRILGGASQSARDLHRRLTRRGFSDTAATEAVQRCREAGYVDDAALAASVAGRHLRHGRGAARVVADLQRRGIDRDAVSAAVEHIAGDEESALRALAAQRLQRASTQPPDEATLRRIAGQLQRRGFSSAMVRAAIREELSAASSESHSR